MVKAYNMLRKQRINDKIWYCLATGMDQRVFAHSTITDYLHDAGFRFLPDGGVQEFYLRETVTLLNPEKGREEVYIALPLQEAQPLINVICTGAQPDGNTEAQTVDGVEAALRQLYRYFSRFTAAYKSGAIPEAFFRAAMAAPLCLLADEQNDELIILPPLLVLRCVTADSASALRFHYPWVHPDGEQALPADAAAFFLAALSYACIAAMPPFDAAGVPFAGISGNASVQGASLCNTASGQAGSGAEEAFGGIAESVPNNDAVAQLVQNIRDGVYVPIKLRCPFLTDPFANLIDCGLNFEKQPFKSEDALPLFERFCGYRDKTAPLFFNLDGNEAQAVQYSTAPQEAVTIFIEKERKRICRKRFFMHNRGKIAVAAAGCIALIAVTISVMLYIKKPPATDGLSVEAVIQGFYTAVGRLDQITVGAYTKNKAAAEYENLMVHLFVTEKMREAYERKKIYYSPEEFLLLCNAVHAEKKRIEQVKPAVIAALNGGSVYGISQLSIKPAAEQSGFFDVSFYYWIPLFPSEKIDELMNEPEMETAGRNMFPIQILRYCDRVHVTEVKRSFFIDSIESLERSVIVKSSGELLNACLLPPARRPAYAQNLERYNEAAIP